MSVFSLVSLAFVFFSISLSLNSQQSSEPQSKVDALSLHIEHLANRRNLLLQQPVSNWLKNDHKIRKCFKKTTTASPNAEENRDPSEDGEGTTEDGDETTEDDDSTTEDADETTTELTPASCNTNDDCNKEDNQHCSFNGSAVCVKLIDQYDSTCTCPCRQGEIDCFLWADKYEDFCPDGAGCYPIDDNKDGDAERREFGCKCLTNECKTDGDCLNLIDNCPMGKLNCPYTFGGVCTCDCKSDVECREWAGDSINKCRSGEGKCDDRGHCECSEILPV